MAYNTLTNELMANPWMFDPSQLSNQFSNYNNARLPGPTYANAPVNAATGQPIQSFLQQNPGGVNLNATPAQPPQQQSPAAALWGMMQGPSAMNPSGNPTVGYNDWSAFLPPGSYLPSAQAAQQAAAAPQQQAAPQPSAAPNNWQGYLNALSNPGRVTTPGATVPQATGSQPAGGVNAAWLQGIGSGAGMNQNFINALRGIQWR